MTNYKLVEFIELVKSVDLIYAHVSLNAAVSNVSARVRKKDILKSLSEMDDKYSELGFFATLDIDKKGRKILRLV